MSNENCIKLEFDEVNELLFKIKVEGNSGSPYKTRLVIDGENGCSYMFEGRKADNDLISFEVPAMEGKISIGAHSAKIEALVEGRYFSPVTFGVEFEKRLHVQAESVAKKSKLTESSTHVKPIEVSASPIVVQNKTTKKETKLSSILKNVLLGYCHDELLARNNASVYADITDSTKLVRLCSSWRRFRRRHESRKEKSHVRRRRRSRNHFYSRASSLYREMRRMVSYWRVERFAVAKERKDRIRFERDRQTLFFDRNAGSRHSRPTKNLDAEID